MDTSELDTEAGLTVHAKIQALCEAYLGRKFKEGDHRVLRRFLSDLQRQNVIEYEIDNRPEIDSSSVLVRPGEIPAVPRQENSDVVPIARADSKIYASAERWANIVQEKNKQPDPKNVAPVDLSELGASGLNERLMISKAKYSEGAVVSPVTSPRPADLPESVGLQDRLGKWKQAEAGSAEAVSEKASITPRVAQDVPERTGVKDRLGKWKQAESGDSTAIESAQTRPIASKDVPENVGLKDRLGKWKQAESGDAQAVAVERLSTSAPASNEEQRPRSLSFRERLVAYQNTVSAESSAAKSKPADVPLETQGVAARRNLWNSVAASKPEDSRRPAVALESDGAPTSARERKAMWESGSVEQKSVGRTEVETEVKQAAGSLKDRLKQYETATAERELEKAPIVVPYDDDYEAPAYGEEVQEEEEQPVFTMPHFVKPSDEVRGTPSLLDRIKQLEEATTEKVIPKAEVVVPYDDDYVPPADSQYEVEELAPSSEPEQVQVEPSSEPEPSTEPENVEIVQEDATPEESEPQETAVEESKPQEAAVEETEPMHDAESPEPAQENELLNSDATNGDASANQESVATEVLNVATPESSPEAIVAEEAPAQEAVSVEPVGEDAPEIEEAPVASLGDSEKESVKEAESEEQPFEVTVQ